MSFRDSMDHVASASEMTSRDEREASLFDEYDDPAEVPASVIYAPRSIGTTRPTLDEASMAKLDYEARIDSALAKAGCCPDGYPNFTDAEKDLIERARKADVPVQTTAQLLIVSRRKAGRAAQERVA